MLPRFPHTSICFNRRPLEDSKLNFTAPKPFPSIRRNPHGQQLTIRNTTHKANLPSFPRSDTQLNPSLNLGNKHSTNNQHLPQTSTPAPNHTPYKTPTSFVRCTSVASNVSSYHCFNDALISPVTFLVKKINKRNDFTRYMPHQDTTKPIMHQPHLIV